MRRSTIPDQILQQLYDVIGVWEENPDFGMGPDVTLEKLKATRVKLEGSIMDVQATSRTLTKQIDDRDDCAKLGNQYVVRARKAIQGYFGPDSTQCPGRRHPPKRPQELGPPAQGTDAAPGRIRRDNHGRRPVLRIPGARGVCRRDVGHVPLLRLNAATQRPDGVADLIEAL